MKNFETAYMKVMNHEGGYSSDKDDLGGETYKGISRVNNPDWIGWNIIDSYKHTGNFPQNLDHDAELWSLVKQLYKKKYWDVYLGDQLDQQIAEEMFDQAVNFGTETAIKNLQRSMNILNTRKIQNDLYPDVDIDGKFGAQTLKTLLDCVRLRSAKLLFNVLNYHQGKRYLELMEKRGINEKYIGWFNRIEIIK